MAFNTHERAVRIIGDTYVQIGGTRGHGDGVTIPFLDTDWGGEALVGLVALSPDKPSLASLTIQLVTEQKTWQNYKDECIDVDRYMPCGTELSETITATKMTISWSASAFAGVQRPTKIGEPSNLYFEVRRANGTGQRFLAGDFILTERIL